MGTPEAISGKGRTAPEHPRAGGDIALGHTSGPEVLRKISEGASLANGFGITDSYSQDAGGETAALVDESTRVGSGTGIAGPEGRLGRTIAEMISYPGR